MPQTRILSLWFPRLAAERILRRSQTPLGGPFAVVASLNNTQTLACLNPEAEAENLHIGQALRDARAFCPDLITQPENRPAEAAFLTTLRRWAAKFTPWVATEAPASLLLDITGCAHLFGGEAPLIDTIQNDCFALGLTVQSGLADTPGAAWALARYAGKSATSNRSGDAIQQEARATRSRAAQRHWTRGGAAPNAKLTTATAPTIAAPGATRRALAPLPIAALRLPAAAATNLNRLGIRRIQDLTLLPRAALARRFGRDVTRRLDQALGVEPEPISPARPEARFATRLTLPDPIGLEADLMAGIDRLLPPLCDKLRTKGRGVRTIRLQLFRSDHTSQTIEASLARPSFDPARIRPLLALKLVEAEAGFGIDVIRLEAVATEPVHPHQHSGHSEAATAARTKLNSDTAIDDLTSRLGGRVGLEAITLEHPADSHIPEKTAITLAAAWAEAADHWPKSPTPRPLVMFEAELVATKSSAHPPEHFQWRRRTFTTATSSGPERLSPQWWLDDPNWRSGVRDYWCVTTTTGERLWLYFAHGALTSGGWFCQGSFA